MTLPEKHIYSVSELTTSIKSLLENEFPFVWISGEVSNFRMPSSGHLYFTLKDDKAQISAVMFRNQQRHLSFTLEDGQQIIGLGRISLYEPRGSYQIILEYIEPKGIGALQIAFEQLRNKLQDEGLFSSIHKKSIPFLPCKISLITSPTGSVVHDILHVVRRRYGNMPVEIVPVKVQGQGAMGEIVAAIALLNQRMDTDVIIIARGGGSLEDLSAFNTEEVARAIFHSEIPIISAVGHETDYTIADFVADLRAPTPSAAAELAVPVKEDLLHALTMSKNRLFNNIQKYIENKRNHLKQSSARLPHPKRKIQDMILRIDDYRLRLDHGMNRHIRFKKNDLASRHRFLVDRNPGILCYKLKVKLDKLIYKYQTIIDNTIITKKHLWREQHNKLDTLNPTAILKRGYSITRSLPKLAIVRNPDDVLLNQQVDIRVAEGNLICRVERIYKNGEKNI